MKRKESNKLKRIDKLMLTVIAILSIATSIVIVYSKSVLSKTNIEVARIREKLEKQETINESITMKINELASLSNIQGIARERGLSYNNENIVIIK